MKISQINDLAFSLHNNYITKLLISDESIKIWGDLSG